jgi:hypothetical protein
VTCAFCPEASDFVQDYLTPVHNDYQEPAVLTLCRAHAARRASAAERPLSART